MCGSSDMSILQTTHLTRIISTLVRNYFEISEISGVVEVHQLKANAHKRDDNLARANKTKKYLLATK